MLIKQILSFFKNKAKNICITLNNMHIKKYNTVDILVFYWWYAYLVMPYWYYLYYTNEVLACFIKIEINCHYWSWKHVFCTCYLHLLYDIEIYANNNVNFKNLIPLNNKSLRIMQNRSYKYPVIPDPWYWLWLILLVRWYGASFLYLDYLLAIYLRPR